MQIKEGMIEEGSPAWQAMSAADQTKRKRAAAEAKTKLKSPNFFVSRSRLCLRNLPHQISEKALKDLVVAAVGPITCNRFSESVMSLVSCEGAMSPLHE